jgi:hypothetical protein
MPQRICKAHRTNGQPCKAFAMRGQMVCRKHGGKTPLGLQAGEQRIAEQQAAAEIARITDAPPLKSISEVYDWLLSIAGTVKAWGEILQARVAVLSSLGYETEYAGTQLRADVILFERALDRSAKLGEALVRLDLEGRKQALDERVAGQLVAVVRAILGDLELTDDQRMVAELVVPKRMKEISA